MNYYYQSGFDGEQYSALTALGIITELTGNPSKSGSVHFSDGTQLAISFADGVPAVQVNETAQITKEVALFVINFGAELQKQNICRKSKFERLFNRTIAQRMSV